MTVTKTSSVKAQSIILLAEDKDTDTGELVHIVQFNNAQSKAQTLKCSDSFYALAKQASLARDKTHTYTLYLNSQGEVYNYDKEIKPTYRFMTEHEDEKDNKKASDTSSMIITFDRDTGEVNILRPFASVTHSVKAKLVDHVTRDIDDLRAEDVLPGGLIITEIRDRGTMKTFYIQK